MLNTIYTHMSKSLNLNKLAKEVDKSPFAKIELAKRCGISRVTLDSVIKGKEIGLFKFLKLVDALGVKVGYFFDEDEVVEVHTAGRDFVEQGSIEHSGTEFNAPMTTAQCDLVKENAELKRKLIEAQERIIKLMEEKK